MERKKIAYISGTRADFGLMTPVLKAIQNSKVLSLKVFATGMHLMPEFGLTIEEVKKVFPSVETISATFEENTNRATVRFIADVMRVCTDAFLRERPDLVLLLGDRPEMLAVATACLYLGIPTGHLHGGERTGTSDEIPRHAITKLSSLHFPATQASAERIACLGEDLWRIQVVGAPALDVVAGGTLPSPQEVREFITLSAHERFILLVQHPGEDGEASRGEIEETLSALKQIALPVVAVYPNADTGSHHIIEVLEKERTNPLFRIFKSIPHALFLALEREASVLVGNSSAALIESASFRTPVVTIGERQRGRLCGGNVLCVSSKKDDVVSAIQKSLDDPEYRATLATVSNPWGDGKTGPRVAQFLEELTIDAKLLNKQISY